MDHSLSNSIPASQPWSNSEELWAAILRQLEQQVVSHQMQTWIAPLKCLEINEEATTLVLRVTVPNDFSSQWVKDHYKKQIETHAEQLTGRECVLSLEVQQEVMPFFRRGGGGTAPGLTVGASSQASEESSLPHASDDLLLPSNSSPPPRPSGIYGPPAAPTSKSLEEASLDPRYVFESFVVGASNQFAHASAVAVAEQPARQYNPLFLYSPPGLGKTHLLHAIGNYWMAKNPRARVAYLSAERFVNELIDSLQHRKMPDFRAKYRNSYDMILIDDIQFIAGKNTSEEEFFHTFNALHGSKRQIVVTSDRAPKEIEGLEERIRTRFEWGLVADISPPEIETRIAILKAKAERDDIYLPDEVATFLATYIKSNVRELEGVLIRLQAQASLTGAEISLEMAKQELKTAVPEEGSHFTLESIQNAVARHFQLKVQDLKAPGRTKSVALARQIAMYLIRKYTGMGFKEIGQFFGGKDHTTIMHACTKIERNVESDPAIRDAVESVQNLL